MTNQKKIALLLQAFFMATHTNFWFHYAGSLTIAALFTFWQSSTIFCQKDSFSNTTYNQQKVKLKKGLTREYLFLYVAIV